MCAVRADPKLGGKLGNTGGEALVAATLNQPAREAGFQDSHPLDHAAVGVMVGLIWFVTLAGFVPDMFRRMAENKPYQLVTHAHAFLAVSWLVLLTSQSALARLGRLELHVRIGRVARWTALALFVASVATAFSADLSRMASPTFRPQQLATQITHIAVFGGLAIWAFTSTSRPSAHKRLILLATIAILDAGASRWLGAQMDALLPPGPLVEWTIRYPIPLLLIAAMGAYDLLTRRRLHPVYLPAAGVIAGSQLLAIWLYFQPAFAQACLALLKAL